MLKNYLTTSCTINISGVEGDRRVWCNKANILYIITKSKKCLKVINQKVAIYVYQS